MWESYGRVRQATVDNIIRRMRIACWIPKATDTHPEHVIAFFFLLSHGNNACANVPERCGLLTLLALFNRHFISSLNSRGPRLDEQAGMLAALLSWLGLCWFLAAVLSKATSGDVKHFSLRLRHAVYKGIRKHTYFIGDILVLTLKMTYECVETLKCL